MPRLPVGVTFAAAACSLVLVFATAGAPIPLYTVYRAADGITDADLGQVSVFYFAAAATALLVFGRLSNHLGRRPVAIAALATSGLSCLVLSNMQGFAWLAAARVLQGLACGTASTAIGSYVVDTSPSRPTWMAAAITGSAPMVGIPLGALTSGALVQYGPAPRVLIFAVAAVLIAICIGLLAASRETMPRKPGAAASLRPRLQAAPGTGRLLLVAGAAFVATWSFGGFYQAFGPSVTADYLQTSNTLAVAAVFSSVMGLNPLGGPLSGKLSSANAVRVGMTAFVLAVLAILVALDAGAIVPFIAAGLVVGLAQGIASTGSIRALLSHARQDERAGLLSTIYLISYVGAATPALVAGQLTDTFDLFQIALGYAGLAIASALLAVAALGNLGGTRVQGEKT